MQTGRSWYLFRMNVGVLLILLVLSWTSPVAKGDPNYKVCTDWNKLGLLQHQKRLLRHTFLSFETRGVLHCAQACLNRKLCKSFNFHPTYGYCELNGHVSTETSDVEDNSQYIYSDNISQWPKILAGECAGHSCSRQETCRTVAPGQVTCDACSNATMCGTCYPVTDIGGRQFTSYGCFQSTPNNVLPHLNVNLRGEIVWTDLTLTIKNCAIAANATGKELFGVKYYGECYVGDVSEADFVHPVSRTDCQSLCPWAVGGPDTMFVYQWI